MNQPGLFDEEPPRRRSIDELFAEYHAANPDVYRLFKRFACELLDAGRDKGSAEQIVQRIRWEHRQVGEKSDGFKFSNYFRSRYALMLAREDPRFRDFFEFRTSKV